jgi:hypothetical protein
MLRGGWANSFIKSKEGTAVGFLLIWCGRSATTLVAAGHSQIRTQTKTKTKKAKPSVRFQIKIPIQ